MLVKAGFVLELIIQCKKVFIFNRNRIIPVYTEIPNKLLIFTISTIPNDLLTFNFCKAPAYKAYDRLVNRFLYSYRCFVIVYSHQMNTKHMVMSYLIIKHIAPNHIKLKIKMIIWYSRTRQEINN